MRIKQTIVLSPPEATIKYSKHTHTHFPALKAKLNHGGSSVELQDHYRADGLTPMLAQVCYLAAASGSHALVILIYLDSVMFEMAFTNQHRSQMRIFPPSMQHTS